eukprot:CCRYP_008420-RA/>CCRYP_008420-RA protein AED:0.29 eAED:0.29 QI:0/0/0/1/1/1/4/0/762
MGPSQSSPSPASLCTKTLTCSSLAKANPSSSAHATHKDVTASHSPNTKDGGNRRPPRRHDKHSDTPTAYTTSHPPNKPSDGCMRCVDIPSSPPGSGPSKPAISLDGQCSPPATYRSTSQRQWKLPKGTLNQCRKNVRSTKPKPIPLKTFQSPKLIGRKLHDIYTHVYDTRNTIFSDQTGQFPHRSSSGNHYLMVMVDIDSSAILVEPIKNRTDLELTRAYSTLINRLHQAGVVPRKHVLDNEISTAMKTLITDTYKMSHRRNAAEVAIRNFKSHFLSILAGVADDFPMKLWDKLLPQAEITINLLRQSNATPTVSAYAHLNGPFDYNNIPLALMGCSVQVHEKSDARGTWAFHSIDGWYLSTSPEHYRTHRCHIKSTNSERLSDTVVFQHKSITHPSLTPTDKLMQAVSACAAALKGITAPTKDITDLKALLDITANHLTHLRMCSKHTTTTGPNLLPTNLAAWLTAPGGRIKGTNTIRFIRKRDIPKNRLKDITYGQFVCTIRPEKKEPNRTHLVVGGDRINYPEYIRMKLSDTPEEIITEYKLRDLVEPDDCVALTNTATYKARATQDEAVLTYHASDMVLAAHSDASYLSEPQARSRAGGHFFLSSNADIPPNNGAILNIAHIIKHVMASATEAELAALFITAREAVYIRIILMELGHKQPATPLQTDNAMAEAVTNGKVQPKRTKAMDMRFHWLRDRECQEQFQIYWRPGHSNYADYWTKHHSAKHHQNICREFITPLVILEMLRQDCHSTRPAAAAA